MDGARPFLSASGLAAGQQGEASGTTPQLVQVLASLDQRLQGVEQWATELKVVNDLLGLSRELHKVKNSTSISSK